MLKVATSRPKREVKLTVEGRGEMRLKSQLKMQKNSHRGTPKTKEKEGKGHWTRRPEQEVRAAEAALGPREGAARRGRGLGNRGSQHQAERK